MLTQFDSIMSGLNVYPGRMKRNLERTGGLIFSQAVMLALTESGIDRQAAYKIVQGHAMEVWDADALGEEGPTFLERLRSDPEVTSRLSPNNSTNSSASTATWPMWTRLIRGWVWNKHD